MTQATVTSRGRITIPAEIRQTLGLVAHDRVAFTVLQDGTTLMRAKTRSAASLRGLLPTPDSRVQTRELSYT